MAFSAKTLKTITALVTQLEDIRAKLEEIHEKETERLDAMPEAAQEGDVGEAHQESLTIIEDAVGTIEGLSESLGEISGD